jgi:lipoprotein-anchoring transpeptidase ErfK/SrfK
MKKSMQAAVLFAASLFVTAGAPASAATDQVGGSYVELLSLNLKYDGRPQASSIPREIVDFDQKYAPGTILVSSKERRLYFVLPEGKAIRYGVGVGRPGFEWGGAQTVSTKREWPSWTPPSEMLKRRPDLPRHMVGGPENPLGARAMYLGSSLYRIHGSNEPDTIGQAVSSGCIRMTNDDVVDLYERVKVGARVIVMR